MPFKDDTSPGESVSLLFGEIKATGVINQFELFEVYNEATWGGDVILRVVHYSFLFSSRIVLKLHMLTCWVRIAPKN